MTVSFNAETVAGQQSNSHILKIAYADIAIEKMTVNSSGSTKEISAKLDVYKRQGLLRKAFDLR